MGADFTYNGFAEFCQQFAHAPVLTVADYLRTSDLTPPYTTLRFDVDYREANALALAAIAAEHGLRGSFYFRHHADGFPIAAMQCVAALDHEVGYHFETLDTCQGNVNAAAELFLEHIATLRAEGINVETVAAHGSQPTTLTYRANFDLLTGRPELMMQAGLLGETTLSIDFSRVIYTSDALWRWRQYNHYTPGARGKSISLNAIMRQFPMQTAGLYINFHPHQWFHTWLHTRYFWLRNRIGHILFAALRR